MHSGGIYAASVITYTEHVFLYSTQPRPSSDTRSNGFELLSGTMTSCLQENKKHSFHTIALHHHNCTQRANVCTRRQKNYLQPSVTRGCRQVMTTFFVLVSLPHSSNLKSMHTMQSWHPPCVFGADEIAAKAITQCPSSDLGECKEE